MTTGRPGACQAVAGAVERLPGGTDVGRPDAPVGAAGALVSGVEGLHLVGEDQVGDVPVDHGRLDCQRRQLGMPAARQDGVAEPGDGGEGRCEIDLLERPGPRHLRGDLARECHHRRPVQPGVPEPGQQVGGPGPRDRQAGGRPARHLRVAGAGEGRRPLVTDAEVPQPAPLGLDAQGLGETEVGVADHAEDGVDPPVHEGFDHHVAHGPGGALRLRGEDLNDSVGLADLEQLGGEVVAHAQPRVHREVVAVPRAAQCPVVEDALRQGTPLMGTAPLEGVPAAVGADDRNSSFADLHGVDATGGQGGGIPDGDPLLRLLAGGPVGLGDRDGLVVLESCVPVAAVAEGLVAGVSAPAEGEVLPARSLCEVDAVQLDRTPHAVGPVAGDLDARLTAEVRCHDLVLLVAEGTRRAAPDGSDDVLRRRRCGVDPRLLTGAKDRRQATGAEAGV